MILKNLLALVFVNSSLFVSLFIFRFVSIIFFMSSIRHIMEHMDGVYKKPEDQMTDEELQFHYFKLHDYDNNNMLDGIELVSAITHFHKGE